MPQDAAADPAQLSMRLAEHGFAQLPDSELQAVSEAWAAIAEHSALLAQHQTRRDA